MAEVFHSQNPEYRSPFGAVTEGTAVHFRLRVPRWMQCRAAILHVERQAHPTEQYGMFWAGMAGADEEWWECHYTPQEPDIYWYDFLLDTSGGRRRLCRVPGGGARLAPDYEAAQPWQLTCYARDFKTPEWLRGGVIYQIFPDRFFRSAQPKQAVPEDRVLHGAWGGQPEWRPDARGIVRNNDYFGGDLNGIREKLPYLQSLGVTCLYLNPIFEAHSNHRYNTADYERVDPLLGTEEELRALAEEARRCGIRLLLDGVFSHTGSDSRYFNREKRYPDVGAYNSPASPYSTWYHFRHFPNDYAGWWGFDTLPEVNECDPSYLTYILGENGIVPRWLQSGASGWRLDVADELPDSFLEQLRRTVKQTDPEALVLGEVWEDASNKYSYGHLRRYLLGRQLDSVMNYPFREAVFGFLLGGGAAEFRDRVGRIVENYPEPVLHLLMNLIGTHDTERALTVLGGKPANGRGREWQAAQTLSPEERRRGLRRLRLASLLQYCLPGVPSLYYGDEAGLEGYRDPFNRGCYPWGQEDAELVAWYRALGALRREASPLRDGSCILWDTPETVAAFVRQNQTEALLCAVNRGESPAELVLAPEWQACVPRFGGRIEQGVLHLEAETGAVLLRKIP